MIAQIATAMSLLSRYSLALSLSSIADPVRDTLDATVRHFSHLVALSTIAVALGVLMEGVELAHAIVEWWKRKRREKCERIQLEELRQVVPVSEGKRKLLKSHSEEPIWVKLILRVGLILVVIGVVGEWRYGAKLEDAHDAVHEYDLAKLTAAENDAALAKDRSGTAYERAANAERETEGLKVQVAQANERAESERLERVKLEATIAWRTVSDEQRKELKNRLKAFSGRTIALSWDAYDPEQNTFGPQFFAALQATGLDVKSDVGGINMLPSAEMAVKGMLVEGNDDVFLEGLSKALVCASLAQFPVPLVRSPDSSIEIRIRPKAPKIIDNNAANCRD